MNPLRIGIVGAVGRLAQARAHCFAEIPGSKVVFCYSPGGRDASLLASRLGCRATAHWQEVVSDPDVDAVCVSSAGASHFNQARAAIAHRKHVLVDYPLTHSMEETNQLLGLARKRKVLLHHGLYVRGEPVYLAALDNIPSLGQISAARITYFGGARSQVRKTVANDVFFAMFVRFIDHMRGWFGEVKAATAKRKDAGDGGHLMHNATAWFRLERCPMAMIELGVGYYHYHRYFVEIFGSDGVFEKSRGMTLARNGRTTPLSHRPDVAVKVDTQNFVSQIQDDVSPLRAWNDMQQTMQVAFKCVRPDPKSPGIEYEFEESESQIVAMSDYAAAAPAT